MTLKKKVTPPEDQFWPKVRIPRVRQVMMRDNNHPVDYLPRNDDTGIVCVGDVDPYPFGNDMCIYVEGELCDEDVPDIFVAEKTDIPVRVQGADTRWRYWRIVNE